EVSVAQGSVNARLKAANHDANGVADPLARQFGAGDGSLWGHVGVFCVGTWIITFIVTSLIGCRLGQFRFDSCPVCIRNAVETVDPFVNLSLDAGQLIMTSDHVVTPRTPPRWGDEVISGLLLPAVSFGELDRLLHQ